MKFELLCFGNRGLGSFLAHSCGQKLSILALMASLVVPTGRSLAVRPFVTDDARIVDFGQLEIETWFEYARPPGERLYAQNIMAGVTITDWLELIVGGGFGWDREGRFSVGNPAIQPKFLVWEAGENGVPGLALSSGVSLPQGSGAMFEDALSGYAMVLTTVRLFDDWLMLHGNLGATYARHAGEAFHGRPYWGIGFDLGLFHPQWRYIAECYAGDPLHATKPSWAAQTGIRWLAGDYLNFDITCGLQPHLDDRSVHTRRSEWWVQFGVRILFDAFTRDGQPGNPLGARGLFRRDR